MSRFEGEWFRFGRGTVTRDEARSHALWNPTYREWFPGGPDDRSFGCGASPAHWQRDNPLKPASTTCSCSMETQPTDAAIGLLEREDRLDRLSPQRTTVDSTIFPRIGLIFASTMN